MKFIKILGFTILLMVLFLQNYDAYGHLACQSERDDAEVAERNLKLAKKDVKAQNSKIDDMWITEAANYPSDPTFPFRITEEENKLKDLERKRDTAQQKVNDARRARDRCIENDRRDCPMQCSKLHTQNNTSCGCNCEYSNSYGCECGPCSSRLGGG